MYTKTNRLCRYTIAKITPVNGARVYTKYDIIIVYSHGKLHGESFAFAPDPTESEYTRKVFAADDDA